MKFGPGDMLITGVKGEIYPCKADVFAKTYEDAVDRPKIITLCGSTRFTAEMLREAWRLTLLGNIVIHWNILEGKEAFAHGAEAAGGNVKEIIDGLYLHKVAMADEVRAINVGGYIGESTKKELQHAQKLGKTITWLEADRGAIADLLRE